MIRNFFPEFSATVLPLTSAGHYPTSPKVTHPWKHWFHLWPTRDALRVEFPFSCFSRSCLRCSFSGIIISSNDIFVNLTLLRWFLSSRFKNNTEHFISDVQHVLSSFFPVQLNVWLSLFFYAHICFEVLLFALTSICLIKLILTSSHGGAFRSSFACLKNYIKPKLHLSELLVG